LGKKVIRVIQDLLELKEMMDQEVTLELMVVRVTQGQQDLKEQLVSQDLKEQ
jgi:hypothetical protein